MNCFYCHGVDTIEEGKTDYCVGELSRPFVVRNVPASICRLCGDESYSADTVETLDQIRNGDYQPVGSVTLQVFDFERLGQQAAKEKTIDR